MEIKRSVLSHYIHVKNNKKRVPLDFVSYPVAESIANARATS